MENRYVIATYLRVSIRGKFNDGFSIDNQRILLKKFVKDTFCDYDYEIKEFVDDGYSGTNFQRPSVQKLIDEVKAGMVNCIVVKDFSRFGRNSIDTEYFTDHIFPLFNIRFIAVNDNYDSENCEKSGGFDVQFKHLMNELYSYDISQKVKTAKHTKMKAGTYKHGNYAYGYKPGENNEMVIDDYASENVRLIFNLAKSGLKSSKIRKILFDYGIDPPAKYRKYKNYDSTDEYSCKYWSTKTIRHILRDEQYIGTYIMRKTERPKVGHHALRKRDEKDWIKIPNHHPAIVSEELFLSVQKSKKTTSHKSPQPKHYPLKSKVYCKGCGHKMSYIDCPTIKHPKFLCKYTKPDEFAICHNLEMDEETLNSIVYREIKLKVDMVLSDSEPLERENSIIDKETTKIKQQIQCYKDEKQLLYEQMLCHEIDIPTYKSKKEILSVKIRESERVLEVKTKEILKTDKRKEFYSDIKSKLENAKIPNTLTQELVEATVDKICIFPDKSIKIIWKFRDIL